MAAALVLGMTEGSRAEKAPDMNLEPWGIYAVGHCPELKLDTRLFKERVVRFYIMDNATSPASRKALQALELEIGKLIDKLPVKGACERAREYLGPDGYDVLVN